MSQSNQRFITAIIDRYGLELEDDLIDTIVVTWIGRYNQSWIVKAIVESIHRGRYKVKSVDSILSGWQRVGKPTCNFTSEFEREILQDLLPIGDLAETQAPPTLSQLDELDPVIQFPGLSSNQLNPEESAPFPHHDCYCRRQAVRATPRLQPPTTKRDPGLPQAKIDPPLNIPPSGSGFKGEDVIELNQISFHPKFQLFHTLRGIVTPNNIQSAEFDDLDPPSYSTDIA